MRRRRRWRREKHSLLFYILLGCGLILVAGLLMYARRPPRHTPPASPVPIPQQSPAPAPRQPPAPVPAPVSPRPQATPSSVTVLFAPTTPEAPAGIDDHLIALINSARKSVLCAFYDLELQSVADALVAQDHSGRKVAIVTDSEYRDRPALRSCAAAGIPIVFDRRSPFMHNKFCIVDGKTVWTGSTNISNNCMYRNNNNALLLQSPELAERYGAEFTEMFNGRRFGGGVRSASREPVLVGTTPITSYFAPEDEVEQVLVGLVKGARNRIEFMAFSFTSKPVAQEMVQRIQDRVRVRGIFERRNAGSEASRDDFLRARGADVRLDGNPYNLHHKVIVIDGATTITGSYNFSRNANTRNDENLLVLQGADIAAAYLEEFERLFAAAS